MSTSEVRFVLTFLAILLAVHAVGLTLFAVTS